MKTRMSTLVNRRAFTASDVIERDIRGTDVISFIDIIVRMTNGAAMTEDSVVKPHDDITKIELVDGGNVIVSLNMEELQALNAYEQGHLPYMGLTLDDGAVQTEACRLYFGFGAFDPYHYLRPADFQNLQIKVTVTMTAAAATAWAAAGHDVTLIAGIMESGHGEYRGYLSAKSVKSYSAVDGTREDIELNTDWPYRAILIQAFKTATRPDENLEIVRLTADDDKHVVYEQYMTELEVQNLADFGTFRQNLAKRVADDADVIYGDLFFDVAANAYGGTALTSLTVISVDSDQVLVGSYNQT